MGIVDIKLLDKLLATTKHGVVVKFKGFLVELPHIRDTLYFV